MPTSCAPAPTAPTAPGPGRVRRVAQRHPLVVLMLVFNVFGQAFVLVPTLVLGERAPNLELLQSIGLLVFLTLHGTLADGLVLMGLLTVSVFFVRAGFGWVHRRTGSLAVVGLVHAASNAAVLGMATRLYSGPADSVVALAAFGILALLLSRGRLGW